jgi:predicted GNAT superfamily acetyltransferase
MAAGELIIRSLRGPEEFHEAAQVQKQAWNMCEIEIVPSHLLITVAKNGGLVLGAFDQGQMLGMLLGFMGQDDNGRYKHCSHMMGVVPSHRGKGIGTALKMAQREFAFQQGLDLITWTYDPLESVNASLNIARLGATSNTYIRNIYGEMRDELNQGLTSDRLQVDWWIRSRRVIDSIDGSRRPSSLASLQSAGGKVINRTRSGERGLLQPVDWTSEDAPVVLFEIPATFQQIKRSDMVLAHAWRQMAREIFEYYFDERYQVTEFLSEKVTNNRYCLYVLEKDKWDF